MINVPCLFGTRDSNEAIAGGIPAGLGNANFTAITSGVVAIRFWACSTFRDLSKTTGKNPQQSTLLPSGDPTRAEPSLAFFALSQCSDIFAKGQESIDIDLAFSVSQQNKKIKPLNHSAMNPAMALGVIFLNS